MKCKGIWLNEACPDNAEAMDGREYCGACWNIGEDLMREQEAENDAAAEDFGGTIVIGDNASVCDDF